MILKFPDLETLRLALISGVIPPAVSAATARAVVNDAGPVWIEPETALARGPLAELRKLGIVTVRTCEGEGVPVSCWAEVLPLGVDPGPIQRLEQTPVLFDLPAGAGLASLALEILRLGNDRITYRWLQAGQGDRALLRVVGPPYYALLRAIDRIGGADAPTAFVERHPRVWVQVGYRHPLAEYLVPPEGKLLLLRPPRYWELLPDAPYKDIYGILEFPLRNAPSAFEEGNLSERLRVIPTLRPAGSPDGAELWVLRDNAIAELNRFVQNADDQLLQRLNFAVGGAGEQTTIVLRVRQSRLPPPVLVLPAIGYTTYLKLSNLFLPVGTRLHPPIRRDAVRKLLAADPDHVVWLHPEGNAGGFRPETLPEESFRPLWDWVDYILDREHHALAAWMQAATFDFEGFICDDEQTQRPKKPGEGKEVDTRRQNKRASVETAAGPAIEFVQRSPREATIEEEEFGGLAAVEPSELQRRLRALEERFLAVEGDLDNAERITLWPELAEVNVALGNHEDAGICWQNALWQQDSLPVDWCWRWFRSEAEALAARREDGDVDRSTWATQTIIGSSRAVSSANLDRLLAMDEPSAADVRALAAYVVFAEQMSPPPTTLLKRLNSLQLFLEKHEKLLPVRAAWLAWSHLIRMGRVDVLALARTRDRLLERLFQGGLRPEQDLPGFLRFAGQPTHQRFREVRQWMMHMEGLAHDWVAQQELVEQSQKAPMEGYVHLLFAFGLARIGELVIARDLLERARPILANADKVHRFLFHGYEYRIHQLLEGKPHSGPLPVELLKTLESVVDPYPIDSMREYSRILEPDERVDPFSHVLGRRTSASELYKEIAEVRDTYDRTMLNERLHRLLDKYGKKKDLESRTQLLRAALDVVPRIGERHALFVLDLVPGTWDLLQEAGDDVNLEKQARLLENALLVAAHFSRIEHIHSLMILFQKMLTSQKGKPVVNELVTLVGQCFRGMRKFGMRDEIDKLLTQITYLVLEGRDLRDIDAQTQGWPKALRVLLHVASNYYYFGRDRQAEPIMQAAHKLLLLEKNMWQQLNVFNNLTKVHSALEKTNLTCVYISTLSQAPLELAQKRLEELFLKLTGIWDNHHSRDYYSRSQLKVIEAVVHAVASDDFTLGTQARRWLDDDEFLVRRRIHRDLRAALAQG